MEARVTYAHIADLFRNLAPQVGCQLYERSDLGYKVSFLLGATKLPLKLQGFETAQDLARVDLASLNIRRKHFVSLQEALASKKLAIGLLKTNNRRALEHLCEEEEMEDDTCGCLNPDILNDLQTFTRSIWDAEWPVAVVLYDPDQLSLPLVDFFETKSVKKKLKENGDMTVADFVKLTKEELMDFPLSDQNLRLLMSRLAKKHIYWGMKVS